jgi:hypothetical protein
VRSESAHQNDFKQDFFNGIDLKPPLNRRIVRPTSQGMTRLRRLHNAASSIAKYAPHVLANAEAARGLEQSLIEALLECLADHEVKTTYGRDVHDKGSCNGFSGRSRKISRIRYIFLRFARQWGFRREL